MSTQPELPARKLNLEARLSVVACRGGESFLRTLFEPLGYELDAVAHNLDTHFVEWGTSDYFTVTLRGEKTLQELLSHLYVLIPVLDNQKHYWMSDDEVERARGVGRKRSLALREFALGVEALERFVRREPLRRVHECVFGVLALESEPVDPRL